VPLDECAAVMQSTQIEERPSDIIVVGVDVVPNRTNLFKANVSNLLPYITDNKGAQVFDAQVTIVVAGDPQVPDPDGDAYPGCTRWVCCEGECSDDMLDLFPPFHVVDAPISVAHPLADLLAAADQWTPTLRPDARKHLWFITPDNRDDTMSAAEFAAEFEALGEPFTGFSTHVAISSETAPSLGGELAVLVELTDGLYHDDTMGDYDAMAFFDAVLLRIKSAALQCEYEIPPPPDGKMLDPKKVNVEYDDGTGLETIGHVFAQSDCAQVGNGWYYDDELDPTTISMCPFTCNRFWEAEEASIDIVFGCGTVPAG
jgi:hypothetical protein